MSVIVFTVGGFVGSFALIAMNRPTIRNRSSSSSTGKLEQATSVPDIFTFR
jgi:hypothetical protein